MTASTRARLERVVLIGLPLSIGLVLLAAIDRDPAHGVTFSNAPFSDEGWRALNARNLVDFGAWANDDWAEHLFQIPVSLAQALVFLVAGVGLVQARLVSVAATVAMTAILLVGLRRPLGLAGAITASIAVATSALTLYYGRLALLETPVACALTIVAVAAIRVEPPHVRRWATVAGAAVAAALAIRANAAGSALGILIAAAIIGARERTVRAFAPLTVVVAGAIAGVWLALVVLPNVTAFDTMTPVHPINALPSSALDWIRGLVQLARRNDGVVGLAWPLIVAAIVSVAILLWLSPPTRWRRNEPLSGPGRAALVGSLWAIAGLVAFGSLDYQPNRYVVSLLPGLALIVGAAVARLAKLQRPRATVVRNLGFMVLIAFLAVPGIVADLRWTTETTRSAMDGQVAVRAIVPEGAVTVGTYAPLFALTARAQTIVAYAGTTVNAGDAYALGARWVFTENGKAPTWAGAHPAAWAARRERWCTDWGEPLAHVCLVELP